MTKYPQGLAICILLAVGGFATGCGDDDGRPTDAGGVDTGSPPVDAGADSGPGVDSGPGLDSGPALDGGPVDGGPPVDGGATPSGQIATARGAADGTADLPIEGVWITYLKPDVAGDGPGFLVQADATGPALYVHVDPVSLTPPAVVGDEVSFRVTEMATEFGQRRALTVSDWVQLSAGHDVTSLVQDVSAAADLVSALDDYESELLTLSATVVADFAGAGTGYESGFIDTAGVSGSMLLRLRLPSTLRAAEDLGAGCALDMTGPMWRFNSVAQPSVWVDADLTVTRCPAPAVTGASASTATEVLVTFSRGIAASSVMADGSQFSIVDGGGGALTVSAAVAGASGVTLSTAAQGAGTPYTVTVASTVTDSRGTGVDAAMNTAMFSGWMMPASGVILNEVDYDQPGTDAAEFVELFNPGSSAVDLSTVALVLVNATGMAEYHRVALSGSIAGGEYIVVAPSAATLTLPGGTRRVDLMATSIQNGPSDGVCLIDTAAGTVLDALSYEGSLDAATIMGIAGTVSLVEGTAASASDGGAGSMIRLPNGSDTDDADTDWSETATPTPGAANL